MLNGLWLGFFLVATVSALSRWLLGDPTVFAAMVESLFAMAKLSVEVMVILFGTLTLWLGFLRIAERAGLVDWLARLLGPLFARLMPEVPRGHPALGLITLNFAANALGLDNAATPIGLKAMKALQTLNPSSTTASNAQILFLVLNASSLTLLPVSIFMYRAQQGATDPTLVFLPILLATCASTLAGLLSVAFMQRLKLWDPVVLGYLIPGALLLGGGMALLAGLSATALATLSSLMGNLTLFGLILLFLLIGALRKVPVYEAFVEGAKEGFEVAKNLLPYLVAMLCAVGVLRASGALDLGLDGIRTLISWTGWDARFVDALPTALVKPFSGSAARAMLIETMQSHGVDSFPALLAATMQGSTETTFYVLAVYFGSVGLQRARHAVGCALLADLSGVLASIGVCYWFFGLVAIQPHDLKINDEHEPRFPHPLCQPGFSPAQRSAVADPACDQWLLVEQVHLLRDVHRATKEISGARRSRDAGERSGLRRTVCRRCAARLSGRWRCLGAVHPQAFDLAGRHQRRFAQSPAHFQLLPAAQPAPQNGGGAAGTARGGPVSGLRGRRVGGRRGAAKG
jgi:spore maturation protein SpmA